MSYLLIYFTSDVNMTSLSLMTMMNDELRQRLLHVWRGLEQSLIDDAVDQWPTRLRACVSANGGHFKHTLWLSIRFLCTRLTLCFTPRLMHWLIYTLRVHYKTMKCDVSFSQGRVSTLFRWGEQTEHVIRVCVIMFFLLITGFTAVQKLFFKIKRVFPELWPQIYCHVF